ncbi:uncharacterized protein LOC116137528 [Pistacia vera]|uniref:uncharacterized protein LOC116137528 n=1 Tax=Pistacia vera TaxID=55513 RepID=UPI001262F212|nr:uncharacterized protein LOC116137528 [Pistacia vera]
MEKLLNPYDKEFMRMAMLKHEETFKEQVHELHRLYQIQKILMKNTESSKSNGLNQELWNSKHGFTFNQLNNQQLNLQHKSRMQLDLEQPVDVNIDESNVNGMLEIIDEREIELTLGPTTYSRRKKPETSPRTSDSGRSFSSSSTGSSHINRTGFQTQKRTNRARQLLSGCELGLDTQFGYQSGSKTTIDNEEQLRQQQEILNQPPWLFQVLSLNMT